MAVDLLARTVRGLEWVGAAELARVFGADDVGLAPREVTFALPRLAPELLGLRTVDDVFVAADRVDGVGHRKDALDVLTTASFPGVYAAIDRLRELREFPGRPSFDVVASLAGRRNYNRYAVEDALAQALRHRLGSFHSHAPDRRTPDATPDVSVRVLLHDDSADLAVRVAARPLHRRDYKRQTGPGTLHPPVAAAMAAIAGASSVLDPCCGDGTPAVEFALAHPGGVVLAMDLDPVRVAHTVGNAARAGARLSAAIADAARLPLADGSVERVITNPPWNRTVELAGSATCGDALWVEAARVLSREGALCAIAEIDYDLARRLRDGGYAIAVEQRLRVAGRVSDVVLATPPGARRMRLSSRLARWRSAATDAGVLAGDGF